MLVFQITDPSDPSLSSNDNNPKIINNTSKIPSLLKVLWLGCGNLQLHLCGCALTCTKISVEQETADEGGEEVRMVQERGYIKHIRKRHN